MATIIYSARINRRKDVSADIIKKIDSDIKKYGGALTHTPPNHGEYEYKATYRFDCDGGDSGTIVNVGELKLNDAAFVEIDGLEEDCLRAKSQLLGIVGGLELL